MEWVLHILERDSQHEDCVSWVLFFFFLFLPFWNTERKACRENTPCWWRMSSCRMRSPRPPWTTCSALPGVRVVHHILKILFYSLCDLRFGVKHDPTYWIEYIEVYHNTVRRVKETINWPPKKCHSHKTNPARDKEILGFSHLPCGLSPGRPQTTGWRLPPRPQMHCDCADDGWHPSWPRDVSRSYPLAISGSAG